MININRINNIITFKYLECDEVIKNNYILIWKNNNKIKIFINVNVIHLLNILIIHLSFL